MKPLLMALFITFAAVGITTGYVALLNIDGMSDFYYGSLLSLMIIVPVFLIIYLSLLNESARPSDKS